METNSQEWLAAYLSSFKSNKNLRKGKDGRKLLDDVKHIDNREYIAIKVMVQAEFSSRISSALQVRLEAQNEAGSENVRHDY